MFSGVIFVNDDEKQPLTEELLSTAVRLGHTVSFARKNLKLDSVVKEFSLPDGATVRCIDSYDLQQIEITPPPIYEGKREEKKKKEECQLFLESGFQDIGEVAPLSSDTYYPADLYFSTSLRAALPAWVGIYIYSGFLIPSTPVTADCDGDGKLDTTRYPWGMLGGAVIEGESLVVTLPICAELGVVPS